MITYDTAFDLWQVFFVWVLPPILSAVLVWRLTAPKQRFAKLAIAVAANLAIMWLGRSLLIFAPLISKFIPVTVTLYFVVMALPFLLSGLVGWLVLALMKAPARQAALGGLIVFAVPYAGLLAVFLLQLNYNSPYLN